MQHEIEQMLHDYETGRVTRREMVTRLGTIAALMAGAGRVIGAENPPAGGSTFQATELNHIALRVTDVPRSREFYVKHLGMEVSRESASSAFLNFGNNFIALFRGDEAGLDHYCYSVRNYNVDQAEEKLRAAGIENIRRTSGRIYFPDPDNLTVQLAAEQHLPD